MRTLPNFLIIGAQKSGTTSLYEYLRGHPHVFMSGVKEIDFFSDDRTWRRGQEWYASQFAGAGTAEVVGEASPSYSLYPCVSGVAERIRALLPDARFVYLMRHPVERMRASYANALANGTERRSMEHALIFDACYRYTSAYALQLEQYLRFFDRSRILLLLADDLRERRAETLRRTLEFLGVASDWVPPNLDTEYHPTGAKRVRRPGARYLAGVLPDRVLTLPPFTRRVRPTELSLDENLRRRLEDIVRPDVMRLCDYMPSSFKGWGLL